MAGITSEQYMMFSFLQFHSGSIWIIEKVQRLSPKHKLLCACEYFLKNIFLWEKKTTKPKTKPNKKPTTKPKQTNTKKTQKQNPPPKQQQQQPEKQFLFPYHKVPS